MTVTDLQRQQAKTPRHTTKTKTGVKAASNTSILTGGKACTKVSINYTECSAVTNYLHADDGVDEEEHADEEGGT